MNRRQACGLLGSGAAMALGSRAAEKPLALPTPEQVAWQDMELEMFVHFGPATWQDAEYDTLNTPPSKIDPSKLDTDQWAEAARRMGAGQVIFVAKHTGGFCWWQTGTTDYCVRKSPWRAGKGDVMRDLATSCRKRGIRLGVYLSPQDTALGARVGGRCQTSEAQAKYNAIYRQQLTELLSRYGKISEVWFDGSSVIEVGDILRRYTPHAMVFQSPHATIRWVGNEEGVAPYPAWNAVPAAVAKSGVAVGGDGASDGDAWLPMEVDARIRADWFWNSRNAHTLKSLPRLMSMYYRSVGYGAVLLLNNTPDTSGLIPETDFRRTEEFGDEIRRRFGKALGETHGEGSLVELALPPRTNIDHIVTMEDIRHGERVREYVVEGLRGGQWCELARGTSIGHKKIDPLAAVEVSRVRLRVIQAASPPQVRRLAAYHADGAEGPGHSIAEAFRYRILKTWTPASFTGERTSWDLDLTPFVKAAGEYEIEFVTTGGGLEVQSLTYLAGGVAANEYVRRDGRKNRFTINVTGLGLPLGVRAVVRPRSRSHGQVSLLRTN